MFGILLRSLVIGLLSLTGDRTSAVDLVALDRQYDRPTYGSAHSVKQRLAVDYAFEKCEDRKCNIQSSDWIPC